MDWSAWAELGSAALNVLLLGVGSLLWALFRSVKEQAGAAGKAAAQLGKDLGAYKLHVAEHYVTQNELTKAVASLDQTMQRLIDAVNQNAKETREGFAEIHRRIDTKADKP